MPEMSRSHGLDHPGDDAHPAIAKKRGNGPRAWEGKPTLCIAVLHILERKSAMTAWISEMGMGSLRSFAEMVFSTLGWAASVAVAAGLLLALSMFSRR